MAGHGPAGPAVLEDSLEPLDERQVVARVEDELVSVEHAQTGQQGAPNCHQGDVALGPLAVRLLLHAVPPARPADTTMSPAATGVPGVPVGEQPFAAKHVTITIVRPTGGWSTRPRAVGLSMKPQPWTGAAFPGRCDTPTHRGRLIGGRIGSGMLTNYDMPLTMLAMDAGQPHR